MSIARGRVTLAVLGVLVVAGATAGALLGVVPLAMAAAALPWAWLAVRRCGLELAAALLLLGLFWVLTVALVVTTALHVPLGTASLVFGAAGIAGLAAVRTAPTAPTGPPVQWRPFAAALIGPVLWAGFQLASQLLPAYQRLSWLMRNDSMNNLIFAREVLRNGGIRLGDLQNPAPLPSSLLAVFMQPGRNGVDPALLLQHDLTGMGVAWGILIMATSLLAGLTASAMARRAGASTRFQVLGAVLGAVGVLSWYATGLAMENGFVNTDVSLPVLLALILVATSTQLSAPMRVSALALGSTVMLAVWSPLGIIPIALLALAVLAGRRELLAQGRAATIAVGVALVQLLAWGVGVTVPTLLSQREALAGAGGIFRSAWWVVFALGIAVVVLDRVAAGSGWRVRSPSLPVAVLAAFAGIGVLLFVSRRALDIWTYYPVKFAWFVTLLLGIIALGLAVGVVGARVSGPALRRTLLAVLSGAVALLVVWTPDITPNLAMNPLDRLVRSQTLERIQGVHEVILANSDAEHPVLFWNGLDDAIAWGEPDVDLWLISLKADTLNTTPLRQAAYSSYSDRSIGQLCLLIPLMGPNLTVVTRDAGLGSEVDDTCGDIGNTVISVR